MSFRPGLAFVVCLAAAGCAGTPGGGDHGVIEAVEPSLRAAAASAEANHDYKGAIQHLTTLYSRHPDDREIGVALARNMRFNGQAQPAADLLQAQLARFPGDPDRLTELAKDYLAADRVALALRTLDQAAAAAPGRWDIPSLTGVALDTLGRNGEAQAAYGRALALSPDNPAVLNNLALSQALAGHLNEAVATLTRAADLPAATAQTRQNLALLLALKGDAADAEKLVRNDLAPDAAAANTKILRALSAAAKGQ